MVQESASKINRYYFHLQVTDDKTKMLADDINSRFNEHSFLKALELE